MKLYKILSISTLALSSFILTNCQNEALSEEALPEISKSNTASEMYPLNHNEPTVIKPFFGNETKFSTVNGNLILGDMILSPEQVEETNNFEKGTILNNSNRKWNKSGNVYVMPYIIDPNLSAKSRVFDAMAHWERNTKMRFVQRTNQRDYVYFTNDGGCYSYVGKIGGRQTISVGNSCSTGNTIHEIGHASGMYHEQSHPRRDEFVTINFENIIPTDAIRNFRKEARSNVKTTRFDLGSIMMYGSFFFSDGVNPTIVRKNGSTFDVQRNGLSRKDIRVINKIYK